MSGVGLDLLEIERLERAIERRPGLASRLFTEAERAYAASRARPGQHLAARFCAKEAVAKALGMKAWSWQDVEVPMLLPGIRVNTSPTNYHTIGQVQMMRWAGKSWDLFGDVIGGESI